MKFFDSLFGKKQMPPKKSYERSFIGARNTRLTNWIYSSFMKPNADTNEYQVKLLARSRELAKNNSVVRAWLETMEKNIIGEQRIHIAVTSEER